MFRNILIAVAILFAPSLAHADWHEASSKHFIVYSDDSEADIRTFTERLERFDAALRYITGTPDKPLSPMQRVTVFQVRDVSAIQKLAGSSSVAGFFQSRASGSMAFVPRTSTGALDPQSILMHEYAHNFMYSNWPGIVFPPWFSEGFAEFVGTAMFRPDGRIILGKPPEYRLTALRRVNDLPASQLVRPNPGKLDVFQRGVLYARGWLLTHYLLMDKDRAAMFGNYLSALNSGKSVEEATKALGDIGSLDAKLNAYMGRKSNPSIELGPELTKVGDIKVRRVSDGEAAVMPARIISSRGVDAKTAPGVADMARRLAAAYPNDAGAQNELAEAEFDAKNYAAADAAAARALAADPNSIHAMLYRGMAQMELAKKNEAASVGDWKNIRAWFLKANKADTEYAQPLILFYDSYVEAKQKPTKGAQDALLYGYVIAPYDTGLRMKAGKALLEMGQAKAARVAYEPIAFGGHSGSVAEIARQVLETLDASGPEAALKTLTDAEAKAKAKAEEAAKTGKKPS